VGATGITGPTGVTGATGATGTTGASGASSLNPRNKIINGNFNIWQRGISFASSVGHVADGWKTPSVGTQAITVERSTDVSSSVNANYSLKSTVTVDAPFLFPGDLLTLQQLIEGYLLLPLKNKSIYLSFWVKSSLTGTYSVALRNSAVDRSYVTTYSISSANTWEQKTIALSHNSTGTWDYINGVGLNLTFALMSEAGTQTATLNSWQAGNYIASTGQVNWAETIGNTFFLSQVQLEEGTAGTPHEHVDIERELRTCKRYYEKSVPHDIYVFTADNNSEYGLFGTADFPINRGQFTVEKRAAPTVTLFATTSGTSGAVRDRGGASDITGVSASSPSPTGFRVTKSAAFSGGGFYSFNWTADAAL
jgi:hypothetical protein